MRFRRTIVVIGLDTAGIKIKRQTDLKSGFFKTEIETTGAAK